MNKILSQTIVLAQIFGIELPLDPEKESLV